jgi:UDP-N-acetyl-D-galactosamine dehydrogenase
MKLNKFTKICIIGAGYVGLPLAINLAKKYNVIVYDKNKNRINQLRRKFDINNDISTFELKYLDKINFIHNLSELNSSDIFIITVPTPIFKNNKPNLKFVINATEQVEKKICKGNIIIYESTFYPGTVKEICVPILSRRYKLNKDFYCGYSPERVNPGDKERTLDKIDKLVSGSCDKATEIIFKLYQSIINSKVHKMRSMEETEAAKIIENTQRDLNVALINEFTLIFNKMNLSIYEILRGASTKWNFLNFKPGLVGGHCIGVDPYYLTYKAKKIGYNPKVILSGRSLNDKMHLHLIKIFEKNLKIKNLDKKKKINILILGITFKENCSDTRNSKNFKVIDKLNRNPKYSLDVYDPMVKANKRFNFYFTNKYQNIRNKKYSAILYLVPHELIQKKIKLICKKNLLSNSFLLDFKNACILNDNKIIRI